MQQFTPLQAQGFSSDPSRVNTISAQFQFPPRAGSILQVPVYWSPDFASRPKVTDSAGNLYVASPVVSMSYFKHCLFTCSACVPGNPHVVTITLPVGKAATMYGSIQEGLPDSPDTLNQILVQLQMLVTGLNCKGKT